MKYFINLDSVSSGQLARPLSNRTAILSQSVFRVCLLLIQKLYSLPFSSVRKEVRKDFHLFYSKLFLMLVHRLLLCSFVLRRPRDMIEWFHFFMKWFSLFILTCVLLSKVSRVCDYYLKLLFLWGSYTIAATLLIPYGLTIHSFASSFELINLPHTPGLFHIKSPWKTSRLSADLISPIGSILGIQWDLKGHENIVADKAYIVVCNHQSSLDVLAVMQVRKHISFLNIFELNKFKL